MCLACELGEEWKLVDKIAGAKGKKTGCQKENGIVPPGGGGAKGAPKPLQGDKVKEVNEKR